MSHWYIAAPMTGHELRRRERAAARFALYASLGLTTLAALLLLPVLDRRLSTRDPEWSRRDFSGEPAVERLRDLIRIDTTSATGSEIAAARHLERELRAMGLEPVVEELTDGKANLWAVLEGQQLEALVLHSHLDTDDVPDAASWRHPPFEGTIEGPWIYGRGAYDMKSVTVAQLEAVRAVQERVRATGERPPRSLLFLATSSEETGSELGARWIVEQHPELVRRSWAVLTEGGVVEATGDGAVKYWGISFAQKTFVRLTACSPSRRQLEQLQAALRGHETLRRVLTDETRAFFEAYAPSRQELLLKYRVANPELGHRGMRTFRGLPSYLQALYRNEVHPLHVEEDLASGGFRLTIVLHLLPGEDLERARNELLPDWLIHGVRIVEEEAGPTTRGSPLDHPAYRELARVVARRHDTESVGPYFLAYYDNDARFFRAAGVPAYGFSPFLAHAPDSFTVGGINERITVPAFLDGVDLYREAVLRLIGWDER